MGKGLAELLKNRIKEEWKLAFLASFIIGLITHIYKFTNTLPNHDALYNAYSKQNMIGSGRWLLAPACMFSSYFDLPWITGLIALFFLSVTAILLVEIFELTNPIVIILMSGMLSTFPAITETFFFEYTSDGYMLAMLMASFAVVCSRIDNISYKSMIVSSLCICCACGIYQAYVSFGAVLMLCYMIFILLTGDQNKRKVFVWLGRQIIIYGMGLALYFVVWKLVLNIGGKAASTYEGINSVGKINAGVLIGAVGKTVKEFVQFFVKWDIRKYGLNLWIVLGMLFLISYVAVIVISVIKSGLYRNKSLLCMLLLSVAAIPFAAFMWFFTSENVIYYVRMEQSLCLIYILTLVLYDRFAGVSLANAAGILVALCIGTNILVANIFYYYMNIAYEKGYSTAQEVATRIHLTDDGTAKDIAVIGELPGFAYEDYKKASLLGDLGPLYVVDHNLCDDHILLPLFMGNYMDFSLSYYANNNIEVPVYESIDSTAPTSDGWEVRFPYVSADEQEKLEEMLQIKEMSVWPASDSIKQIDDTIVIKFSEPLLPE